MNISLFPLINLELSKTFLSIVYTSSQSIGDWTCIHFHCNRKLSRTVARFSYKCICWFFCLFAKSQYSLNVFFQIYIIGLYYDNLIDISDLQDDVNVCLCTCPYLCTENNGYYSMCTCVCVCSSFPRQIIIKSDVDYLIFFFFYLLSSNNGLLSVFTFL